MKKINFKILVLVLLSSSMAHAGEFAQAKESLKQFCALSEHVGAASSLQTQALLPAKSFCLSVHPDQMQFTGDVKDANTVANYYGQISKLVVQVGEVISPLDTLLMSEDAEDKEWQGFFALRSVASQLQLDLIHLAP